ncbi:lymphocyte antigen 6D [Polymixia lowei]
MKTLLLLVLLVVLMCSTQVHTLRCYTCESDENCKLETECPSTAKYCKTAWTSDSLSRTCAELCDPGVDVECCETDLC